MTIYYRDDSFLVNSTLIQTGDHVYPLAELDAVWLEYGPWQPERLLGVFLLRLIVGVAGVGLVAAAVAVVIDVHHPTGGLLPTWVVYGYLFGSPVVLGVLFRSADRSSDRGARTMVLCAQFRGETVTLFTTTNPTRFGQVHRAVLRALEHGQR
jgi:Family of unknown function (DUF6232)